MGNNNPERMFTQVRRFRQCLVVDCFGRPDCTSALSKYERWRSNREPIEAELSSSTAEAQKFAAEL